MYLFRCRNMRLLRLLISRPFSCSARRLDAAYEGPGKTTVAIMNEEKESLLIDAFSKYGFLLNNGFRVLGPCAIFPDAVFNWNIKSTLDVNENSFALFELLHPKPEIVIFGYGIKSNAISKTVSFSFAANKVNNNRWRHVFFINLMKRS